MSQAGAAEQTQFSALTSELSGQLLSTCPWHQVRWGADPSTCQLQGTLTGQWGSGSPWSRSEICGVFFVVTATGDPTGT